MFEEDMTCPDISAGADLVSSTALLCDVLKSQNIDHHSHLVW